VLIRGWAALRYLFVGEHKIDVRRNPKAAHWATRQARAHLPEVQPIIRREIYGGNIRVVPAPSGGIRIIPTDGSVVEEPHSTPHGGHETAQARVTNPDLCVERTIP
jgi:hypothetical protein